MIILRSLSHACLICHHVNIANYRIDKDNNRIIRITYNCFNCFNSYEYEAELEYIQNIDKYGSATGPVAILSVNRPIDSTNCFKNFKKQYKNRAGISAANN